MRYRWLVFALLVGALAFVAAGCGGDDDGGGAPKAARTSPATISIMAIWGGDEQESFQAVIDGLQRAVSERDRQVHVRRRQPAPLLSTAVEGGNPPDIAAIGQPGLMADFAAQDALQSIDDLRETIVDNFGESVADVGGVDGTQYGLLFKAANKSTIWYNVAAFEEAGVEPPETWEGLNEAAATLKAAGITPYSVGVDVGWPMTDLFENIYLRTAGAGDVRPARAARDPVDGPVREGRADDHGRRRGRLRRTWWEEPRARWRPKCPTRSRKVFTDSPEAAMVIIGDFAPGVIETTLEPETGYNVFTFPSIEDSGAFGRGQR